MFISVDKICLATVCTCYLLLFCLLCILEMQEMRELLLYLILAYRTRSLLSRVLWVLLKVPKAHETFENNVGLHKCFKTELSFVHKI